MNGQNNYYVPRLLSEDEMCALSLKAMKIGQNANFVLLGRGTMIEFYKENRHEQGTKRKNKSQEVRER
jgi:hypothetical protein